MNTKTNQMDNKTSQETIYKGNASNWVTKES